jgi:hypothetical protein
MKLGELEKLSNSEFLQVLFQVNRAIAVAHRESHNYKEQLDQLAEMCVNRLEKREGETVKPYHLDCYSDFIQLIISRRINLQNERNVRMAFDNNVADMLANNVEGEGLRLDLSKTCEIFCGLNNKRSQISILKQIIEDFKDPTQVRSTRKI